MARAGTGRSGGSWRTVHAEPVAFSPEMRRDPWLAQPTACGKLRKETRPAAEFVAFEDGRFRIHKCKACSKVLGPVVTQ